MKRHRTPTTKPARGSMTVPTGCVRVAGALRINILFVLEMCSCILRSPYAFARRARFSC